MYLKGDESPRKKEEINLSEDKKRMDLRYITINGLDPSVEKKMEEDLKRTGYSGTKSAYVTQLCSEALDARARRSQLTTQKDVDSLSAKMDAMSAKLDALADEFGKEKAESEVYRMLLCECYHALEMLLATQGGDVDVMRFFRKGWYDDLPENLSAKMDEVRKSYANA